MDRVNRRILDRLRPAGRPPDRDLVDAAGTAQTVVEAPLVLGAESTSSTDLLPLTIRVPLGLDARPDCASVACAAFELEINPVPPRRHRVPVDQQRSILIRDDDVEHAAI